MTERPVFVPSQNFSALVDEISLSFSWHPGFSPTQKKKNVKSLHDAAAIHGYAPVLEVSTKSDEILGQHLSAFHLKIRVEGIGDIFIESAFQGSKVFELGGPYSDLYTVDAKTAKRDTRLRDSGKLIGFNLHGTSFPLEPKSLFYDWLYVNAIYPHRIWLRRLLSYAGFTDIEFNPARSINCQARSCALFVTLLQRNLLDHSVESPECFAQILNGHVYLPHLKNVEKQPTLLVK